MFAAKLKTNRLALGTVQFGVNYGISNKIGITKEEEVREILKYAYKNGVKTLDTAPSYGSSEEVIGVATNYLNLTFNIITKTKVFKKNKIDKTDIEDLIFTFRESLRKMKQEILYALLVHNVSDLLVSEGNKIWDVLEELKESKKVQKIGFSVYSPQDVEKLLEKFHPDIIQIPINILDQRMLKNSYLKYLKEQGIEIHGRSVFLQGLLLMKLEEIPDYFASIKPLLTEYHRTLSQIGIKPLSAALYFVFNQPEIDYIIVGVNNKDHLKEIEETITQMPDLESINYSDYAIDDERIVNPSLWKL